MTVRLVLIVDIAGWEIKVTTEPMAENVADILLLELARDPSLQIKKASKVRG